MDTIILTKDDIAEIVNRVGLHQLMDDIINKLRKTFRNFDDELTQVRARDGFSYLTPYPGVLEWMPVMQVDDFAVIKVVSYNPGNPLLYQVPTIISTLSLYNIRTGHLMALTDGTFATALRTGAASAIASEVLANPASEVVGLVGCGAQAVTQLHALSRLFDIKRVLAYDTDKTVLASFSERCRFLDLDIQIVPREELEAEADIICTATSVGLDAGPVIDAVNLKSWVHINAVGSDLPRKIELPLELLKESLVCPDYRAQAVIEGECQQLEPGEIGPELIQLVKNAPEYKAYQMSRTVFDSTGFALEDKAAMQVLLSLAKEVGVGRTLPVESIALDPMDPYSFAREHVGSELTRTATAV
jgi:L-lysine cyclodeaminase